MALDEPGPKPYGEWRKQEIIEDEDVEISNLGTYKSETQVVPTLLVMISVPFLAFLLMYLLK